MPHINRKPLSEKKTKYKRESKQNAADHYGSPAWKRLRDTYISLHPLCQCCLEHERVEPATDVHHAVPWSRGESDEEQWQLFLDEKNLISLCGKCHTALHVKDNMYHLGRLDTLTDKEYEYAHGLNYLKK